MGNQELIFSQSEGDNWFYRNLPQIESTDSWTDVNFIKSRLRPFNSRVSKILEVGCAAGHKVESLATDFDAEPFGIDPSARAVDTAVKRTGKSKNFRIGTADKIEFPDSNFDLVFVAFCLYLVSREALDVSINEIDRVLKDGGFLVLEDFDPGIDLSRDYIHHPDITTYKSNYGNHFLNMGNYYLVEKRSFSHTTEYLAEDINERISIQILQKLTTNLANSE